MELPIDIFPSVHCLQGWEKRCTLDDPITDHVYDFNPLGKAPGDYHVENNGVTYYINMCKVRMLGDRHASTQSR